MAEVSQKREREREKERARKREGKKRDGMSWDVHWQGRLV
jgi:hypothetical protein